MGYRRELLEEAADLVEGDRNASYGDPNQDFARTAAMWNAYLSGLVEREGYWHPSLIQPQDIAWMMILLKASRATVSPIKRDHYADAAGYAACGAHCVAQEEPPAADPSWQEYFQAKKEARVKQSDLIQQAIDNIESFSKSFREGVKDVDSSAG